MQSNFSDMIIRFSSIKYISIEMDFMPLHFLRGMFSEHFLVLSYFSFPTLNLFLSLKKYDAKLSMKVKK